MIERNGTLMTPMVRMTTDKISVNPFNPRYPCAINKWNTDDTNATNDHG